MNESKHHAGSSIPSVTIIVPNLDGAPMLERCLASIASLDFSRDLLEVIVVDNGSTDGSRGIADAAAIDVIWVGLGHNMGFAPAVNAGVQRATGELVAFINNDVEVTPAWLGQMVEALGDDPRIGCVASPILDRHGTHVDFFDAAMNFHGFADQPGFGLPADARDPAHGDIPFACGGAMLMPRELFLHLGGFDDRFFAYFEDVDLGWRIRLNGRRIVMAPAARVRHRHGATSRRMAPEQKTLLLERNALLMLFKNVDAERRDSSLAAALMLLIARSLDEMRSDRRRYVPFASRVWGERVPATAIARLHAAVDVLADLPSITEDRAAVQRLRRLTDDELLGGGMTTLRPLGATSPEYETLVPNAIDAFGLGSDIAGDGPRPRVTPSRIGASRGWLRDQARRRHSIDLLARVSRRIRVR